MLANLFCTPVYRHIPKAKDELLKMLRDYVETLNTENVKHGNSTRGGYQSPPTFFNQQDAPVLKLQEEIGTAFKEYFPAFRQAMQAVNSTAPIPKDYDLWGWVTSYDHNGWNAPHIHPRSLVSGVYWVETPAQILENKDGDYAGWLGFQDPRTAALTWPLPDPLTHFFVPPDEGVLVLFPSYLSHFVPPFSGSGKRTSIAFNMRHKWSETNQLD